MLNSWACSAELSMKEVSNNYQYFKIYKQNNFHAQLSWAWKKFYNLGAGLVIKVYKYQEFRRPSTHSIWTLRKHAYSNNKMYIENFTSKNRKFSGKKLWLGFTGVYIIFIISAQNIVCGYSLEPPRRGGSNEYPQSMFLSRNMKNNIYPCKPQFYYIKVGFKGVKTI